jgi:hypothetical protein
LIGDVSMDRKLNKSRASNWLAFAASQGKPIFQGIVAACQAGATHCSGRLHPLDAIVSTIALQNLDVAIHSISSPLPVSDTAWELQKALI